MLHQYKSTLKSILPICMLLFIAMGCGNSDSKENEKDKASTDDSKELKTWLNKVYERNLMLSPEDLTSVGRKDRQSELNNMSEEFAVEKLAQAKKDLEKLQEFDFNNLDEESKISYRLF